MFARLFSLSPDSTPPPPPPPPPLPLPSPHHPARFCSLRPIRCPYLQVQVLRKHPLPRHVASFLLLTDSYFDMRDFLRSENTYLLTNTDTRVRLWATSIIIEPNHSRRRMKLKVAWTR